MTSMEMAVELVADLLYDNNLGGFTAFPSDEYRALPRIDIKQRRKMAEHVIRRLVEVSIRIAETEDTREAINYGQRITGYRNPGCGDDEQ